MAISLEFIDSCKFWINFSFFVFKDYNKWYKCESFNINEYEPQNHNDMFDDNGGNLMMAFYEVIN